MGKRWKALVSDYNLLNERIRYPGKQIMKLYITHSKWSSPDHFEALGCEDTYPNMVIRFDFTTENGWKKWRHGGWLPINLDEVPTEVMVRYGPSKPQ
jgi:hypothetical protein